jgi:hypothetical protein
MNFSIYKPSKKLHECATSVEKLTWARESSELEALFYNDMAIKLGYNQHPKRPIFERIVYDLGHSGGYSEIYNYAIDLVELLKP